MCQFLFSFYKKGIQTKHPFKIAKIAITFSRKHTFLETMHKHNCLHVRKYGHIFSHISVHTNKHLYIFMLVRNSIFASCAIITLHCNSLQFLLTLMILRYLWRKLQLHAILDLVHGDVHICSYVSIYINIIY